VTNDRKPSVPAPREDWRAVAKALNARMTALGVGQQQLAGQAGVSVATLRVLQHGAGGRRVQDSTLAAVCRALDWPANYLRCVLLSLPLPEDTSLNVVRPDLLATLVLTQAEILAAVRRIEAHVEGIARITTPA
jgi:DNA-binding Xre family transcriptional regulator